MFKAILNKTVNNKTQRDLTLQEDNLQWDTIGCGVKRKSSIMGQRDAARCSCY